MQPKNYWIKRECFTEQPHDFTIAEEAMDNFKRWFKLLAKFS